jgi:TRAP-type transport system small permease protein
MTMPEPTSSFALSARNRTSYAVDSLLALALFAMVILVFTNVVLRYGFGTGIAAGEELTRLLFVWMVFTGAVAAYPAGEHMAFTGLLSVLQGRPRWFALMVWVIRLLTLLACILLARGAWQQMGAAWGNKSAVLGYPSLLLPLPVLLCTVALGCMVVREMVLRAPMQLDHHAEVE